MHLTLLALAEAAVPLEIPAGEDPLLWQEPAALAGLELGPAGEGPWVRIEGGASWTLVVEDRSGALRRLDVEPADEASEREELVFLASSLLTPLPRVEPAPAPRPTPAPEPEPEVEPLPVPTSEPAPQLEPPPGLDASLRLAAGAGWGPGLGLEPVFSLGPRVGRKALVLGVDVELAPYLALPELGLTRHALAGQLRAGLRHQGPWDLAATAGAGLQGQLFLTAQAVDGGVVPTSSLALDAARGPLGLAVQADLGLRQVELLSDAGSLEPRPLRLLVSATWLLGDRSGSSMP